MFHLCVLHSCQPLSFSFDLLPNYRLVPEERTTQAISKLSLGRLYCIIHQFKCAKTPWQELIKHYTCRVHNISIFKLPIATITGLLLHLFPSLSYYAIRICINPPRHPPFGSARQQVFVIHSNFFCKCTINRRNLSREFPIFKLLFIYKIGDSVSIETFNCGLKFTCK